jgi:filamentous hemagglutinin family protein
VVKALSLSPIFQISLCTLGYLLSTSNISSAQVTSDGTTGTVVDANGNSFEINAGTRSGGNLFHSFGQFSVPTGGQAVFNNALDVSNILSRVTGGNVSNIDGLIQANGSANLFLINPAGIIFGENASLNIGGSFLGSTADSILFEDGEFSATDLENPPLLTINAPIGLSLRDNSASILSRDIQTEDESRSFTNSVGQNLALIGGDINLKDAILNLAGGQITIGGLASEGIIQINENGSLNFPNDTPLANVLLENSQLSVETSQGGSILINAENLQLSQNSFIFADATGESAGNQLESGNIEILAKNINLRDDSAIQVFTFDEDDAANVLINADLINLENNSQIISGVGEGGIGNSGDISINTNFLSLTGGSRIETLGFGQGNTGDIQINAADGIFLNGRSVGAFDGSSSYIATSLREGGVGNSGDIEIRSGSLFLNDGAFIFAGVSGRGNAGDINIDASDIKIDGINDEGFSAGIFSRIFEGGVGNGGNINISADRISLSNGGQINSSTDGLGDAGNLTIQANSIELSGSNNSISSSLSTGVGVRGVGNAGNLTLDTENLSVSDGAEISVSTFAKGNGGNLDITANNIELVNGNISSSVGVEGEGDAGNIDITSRSLTIADGGNINAGTFGNGNAGNIAISSIDVSLFNNAEIIANSDGDGEGGSIFVKATNLELDNSFISATTNSGVGGNTNLQIEDTLSIFNNSSISTRAFDNANAGNIEITSKFIIGSQNKIKPLSSIAEQGKDGNIRIEAEAILGIKLFNETSSSFVDLINQPKNIVESEQTVDQTCRSDRIAEKPSGLTIKGKGGIPAPPDQPLAAQDLIINGEIVSASAIPEPIETSQGKIQLARGIKFTKDGGIILTPYPTNNAGERIPEARINCGEG